jgi:hypothetical protein
MQTTHFQVSFFDDLSPYVPTQLPRFCFIWLNDDENEESTLKSITDRSIWVYSSHVELFWKTEVIKPSGKWKSILQKRMLVTPSVRNSSKAPAPSIDTNQKEMKQHTYKIGFGHLLHHFLEATPETQLSRAVELFQVLNATQQSNREHNPSLAARVFPPEQTMSDGRQGYFVYQVCFRGLVIDAWIHLFS